MSKLLIIDNDQDLLFGLEAFFRKEKYEVMTANNGDTALDIIKATPPDLIISGVMISSPNGLELKKILIRSDKFRDIPVLILTTRSSIINTLDSIVDYQIDGYIAKPFDTNDLLVHVKLLILCSRMQRSFASKFEKEDHTLLYHQLSEALDYLNGIYKIQNSSMSLEEIQTEMSRLYEKFLRSRSIRIDMSEHLARINNQNQSIETEFIRDQIIYHLRIYPPYKAEVDCNLLQLFLYHFMILGSSDDQAISEVIIRKMNDKNIYTALRFINKALEFYNHEDSAHRMRLANLFYKFNRHIKYENFDLEQLYLGAFFHDLGMINIPTHIVQKKGKLSEEEFREIKKHPLYAYDLLLKIDYLNQIVNIPRYHHERWDGSGYPFGLRGEAIPIEARIFSILDSWVSMTSARIFRSAFSWEEVAVYFENESEVTFQKELLDSFMELMLTGNLE
jgi:response regulator RpfG family c-di-GMP phosphodiesterase